MRRGVLENAAMGIRRRQRICAKFEVISVAPKLVENMKAFELGACELCNLKVENICSVLQLKVRLLLDVSAKV